MTFVIMFGNDHALKLEKKWKWKCRERALIYLALNDVVSGALILFLSHFNINNGNNNNENENGKKRKTKRKSKNGKWTIRDKHQ